jgi:hypothetical protein
MSPTRRLAAVAVASAIGISSLGAPALGTTSHWSKSQCQSYAKGFKKRNPHPSKARRAKVNRLLRAQRCSQRV